MRRLPTLPCDPCPHGSVCCSHGTNLTDDEAVALGERYGMDKVVLMDRSGLERRFGGGRPIEGETLWNGGEPEWATAVGPGGCVFLVDNACSIHGDPSYPAVCRMFPWRGLGRSGLAVDAKVCPEMRRL